MVTKATKDVLDMTVRSVTDFVLDGTGTSSIDSTPIGVTTPDVGNFSSSTITNFTGVTTANFATAVISGGTWGYAAATAPQITALTGTQNVLVSLADTSLAQVNIQDLPIDLAAPAASLSTAIPSNGFVMSSDGVMLYNNTAAPITPTTGLTAANLVTDGFISTASAGGSSPASTTAAGIVELATSAESITGTDTTRVITPAGLTAVMGSSTTLETLWDTTAVATVAEAAALTTAQDVIVELADGTLRKVNIADLPSSGGGGGTALVAAGVVIENGKSNQYGTFGSNIGSATGATAVVPAGVTVMGALSHYYNSITAVSKTAGPHYVTVTPGQTLTFIYVGGSKAEIQLDGVTITKVWGVPITTGGTSAGTIAIVDYANANEHGDIGTGNSAYNRVRFYA